jgi:hypothetical protein
MEGEIEMSERDDNNNIELLESQYDYAREYWQEFADQRADYLKRAVTISINGNVRYTAWPKRDSVFKGIE